VVALADDRDGTAAPLVWMRRFRAMPEDVKARVRAIREEARQEYLRLLYVGMTRAKDRLYVCGTLKQNTDRERGWHALVTKALEGEAVDIGRSADEPAFEWRPPAAAEPAPTGGQAALPLVEPLPAWLGEPVPPLPAGRVRLAPSAALGADEDVAGRGIGAGDGRALRRGTLVHRLLEALPGLPAAERAAAAARYMAAAAADWTASDRDRLCGEVLAVLEDRRFAAAFAPMSRAEIDIAGRVTWRGRPVAVSGRIDRLSIADARVLIVDYKTNRPAPATPAGVPPVYVAQLALYRRVLATLYPGHEVAAALLWTSVPALMEIPPAMLDAVEKAPAGAAGAG
jgi:ATP-dependent helicase/nuclease subunit A